VGLRFECASWHALSLALLALAVVSVMQVPAWAQGETTSAIIGQVSDTTGAVVPDATVTITNQETGLKRTAKTDSGGRLNFPQLKPGTYAVRVEA
jgi:protocatechuate 3,4-dioxygenase beta subunit